MRATLLVLTLAASDGRMCSRRALWGVCCGCGHAMPASALTEVLPRSASAPPRNEAADAAFAQTMAKGMSSYEVAAAPIKRQLFSKLLAPGGAVPRTGAVVVELGAGTLPNARFYAEAWGSSDDAPRQVDLIGVDPNDAMAPYARDAFRRAGLGERCTLRTVNGVAEALPLADGSADVVVSTLTLCSVVDPDAALREVVRVLKPGGAFLFVEHVLSEDDAGLAAQQRALSPLQVLTADGCHLDRRTLDTVRATDGFARVDAELTSLRGFWYLSPTAAGVAVKRDA
jgi:ubiquinone/menaquinone biosynthesis C-methylase UbiE